MYDGGVLLRFDPIRQRDRPSIRRKPLNFTWDLDMVHWHTHTIFEGKRGHGGPKQRPRPRSPPSYYFSRRGCNAHDPGHTYFDTVQSM